jgi:hypothetical protein
VTYTRITSMPIGMIPRQLSRRMAPIWTTTIGLLFVNPFSA